MNSQIEELFRLLVEAQELAEPEEEGGEPPVLGLLLNTDGTGQLNEDTTKWSGVSWQSPEEGVEVMRDYIKQLQTPKVWTREENIPYAIFARDYPDLYQRFLEWIERSSDCPPECVTHFDVSFLNGEPVNYMFDKLDEELIHEWRAKKG